MNVRAGQTDCDLTYCLNVHPGETWAENLAALDRYASRVHAALGASRPFGLGLRLGSRAARELLQGNALEALLHRLDQAREYVFTLNGFPYGAFHGAPVKTAVYRPDWRDPERLRYTLDLAVILDRLTPEGKGGSISTVPGSYREWIVSDDDRRLMAENLADAACTLDRLHDKSGKDLHLGLEPEPDCFLECTPDCLRFFEEDLERWAVPRLAASTGAGRGSAREILRRRVGVCFDTCHLAVQYEDLQDSARRLARSGIRLSKVQVSAALRMAVDAQTTRALSGISNPVYLHPVKARLRDGTVRSRGDLPEALAAGPDMERECEWRVHCHVPLYLPHAESPGTTAGGLTPRLFEVLVAAGARHFELETYTFAVLPGTLRRGDIVESIVAEFQWLHQRLKGSFDFACPTNPVPSPPDAAGR